MNPNPFIQTYTLGQTELFRDFIPEEKLKQISLKKGNKSQGARFNATFDDNAMTWMKISWKNPLPISRAH